jgi:hypothetical protein
VNFKDDDRTTDPGTKIEEDRKLSELVTHLDLLLNQHDPLQKALWNISDQIHKTAGPAERGLWMSRSFRLDASFCRQSGKR